MSSYSKVKFIAIESPASKGKTRTIMVDLAAEKMALHGIMTGVINFKTCENSTAFIVNFSRMDRKIRFSPFHALKL